MKYFLGATALLGAVTNVAAQGNGCSEDGGNWYCALVNAISYTGVGPSSQMSYNKVTSMDSGSGSCSSSPYGYSGPLSPLDEEVSMHIRGPIQLSQFAVYTPNSGSSKSKARRAEHRRRHAHGAAHGHAHAHEKRAVGDIVYATIDGQLASWTNEYSGAAPTSAAAAVNNVAAAAPSSPPSSGSSGSSSGSDSGSGSDSSSSGSSGGPGDWGRSAYYNAQDGTADGLVFLNHNGGSGSGVFDYTFGNSLSYASADGTQGASSPQTLSSTTLPSVEEVVIMSNQECQNGDCGFVRPGTVAYHGFDGPSKAFFYEFQMPDDGQTAASPYDPVNMPAIWMLNAQIPNTLQYGNADCSCWTSGCGEFDIFEVLSSGSTKAKSTLHGNIAGGDSNYFDRPTSSAMKLAVVMYDDNIHIKVLDSSYDFPDSMSESDISSLAQETSSAGPQTSIFNLAGAAAGKK